MDGTMVLDRRPLATGLIVFVKFCDEEGAVSGPLTIHMVVESFRENREFVL